MHLQTIINQCGVSKNNNMIIGGDWHTILSLDLDKAGRICRVGETVTT